MFLFQSPNKNNPFNQQYKFQGQCYQFKQQITQNSRQLSLAQNINTKEQVIIKEQPVITFEEKQLIEKLKTAELKYIVKYIGLIEIQFNKKIQIISEYCGQPYSEFMKSQKYSSLTKDQKMNIFQQMMQAVNELHSLGQKHYNLTLDSFVINQDTLQVKLNDFGLQKISNIDKSLLGLDYYQYSAPETRTKNYYDQTDSWSLGCILYVILTGTTLFSNFPEYSSSNQFFVDRKLQSQLNLSNIEKEMLKKLLQFLPNQRIQIPQFILTYFSNDSSNFIYIDDCQFQLIKFIGYGNSGIVYQAMNLKNKEIVTIKQYWNINETKLKGLCDLKQSQTLNIVEIKKIKNLSKFQVFVVFEFVQDNLQNYIQTQQFKQSTKEQKNLIFQQMILAIKQFQNIFFVHGKLNFESFSVFKHQNEIKIKLMNFGFSNYNIQHNLDLNYYFYKAPEQLQFNTQQFNNYSDLWALGCLWFELLTGIRFIDGNTIDQIKMNIIFSNQQQIWTRINNQFSLNETEKKFMNQLILKSPSSQRIKIQDLILYVIPQSQENSIVINNEIYDKLQQIGSGMQGYVYMGISRKSGQKVAIKVQKVISEIELKLLKKLEKTRTQNLLEIYGVQEKQDKITIIMELGPQDLNSYMKTKEFQQLNNNEKNLIFLQMVQAVEDLHSLGFIHSDAKPDNFIIGNTQNGETYVKLIDFGVCLELKNDQNQQYSGSPQIMAPECFNNQFDTPTDVWALGCTWFEMLTGDCFFKSVKKLRQQTQVQINDRINQQRKLTEFEKQMLQKFLFIQPVRERMKLVEFINILLEQSSSKLQKVLEIKTNDEQKQIQNDQQIREQIQNKLEKELQCRIKDENESQLIQLTDEIDDVGFMSITKHSNINQEQNIIQYGEQQQQIQQQQTDKEGEKSEKIDQQQIKIDEVEKEELQKEIEFQKQEKEKQMQMQIQKEMEISIQEEYQRQYIKQQLKQQEEEQKQRKKEFQEVLQRVNDLIQKLEQHFKEFNQNLVQALDKINSFQIDADDSLNMIGREQSKLITQQKLFNNRQQELEQIIQSENLQQLNQLESNLKDFYEQLQIQEELILENLDEKIKELEKIYDQKVLNQLKQSKDKFQIIYDQVYRRNLIIQEKLIKVTQNYKKSKLQIQNDLDLVNQKIQQTFQQLEVFKTKFNNQQQANSSIEQLINQLQDFYKEDYELTNKLEFLENQLEQQEKELEILYRKNKMFQQESKQLLVQLETYQNDCFICKNMKKELDLIFSQFSELLQENSKQLEQKSNITLQKVQDITEKLDLKLQQMKACNKKVLQMRENSEIDQLKEVQQKILQTIQSNKNDWQRNFQDWFNKNNWVLNMDKSFSKDLEEMKNEQNQFLQNIDQDLKQIDNSQQIPSIFTLNERIVKYKYLLQIYQEKFDQEIDLKQQMLSKKIRLELFNHKINQLQIKIDDYFQNYDLKKRIKYEEDYLDNFKLFVQQCQNHLQNDQQLLKNNQQQLLSTESDLKSQKNSLNSQFDGMLKLEQEEFNELQTFYKLIMEKYQAINFKIDKIQLQQSIKLLEEYQSSINQIKSQIDEKYKQSCDKSSIIIFLFQIEIKQHTILQAHNHVKKCIDIFKNNEAELLKLGYLAKAIQLFHIICYIQRIEKLQQKQILNQSGSFSMIDQFSQYKSQFNQLKKDIEKDQYQKYQQLSQIDKELKEDEENYKKLQNLFQTRLKVRLRSKILNQQQINQIIDLYQFFGYCRIKVHIIFLSQYGNLQWNIY